jgi:hypothetical protein
LLLVLAPWKDRPVLLDPERSASSSSDSLLLNTSGEYCNFSEFDAYISAPLRLYRRLSLWISGPMHV